MYRFPENSEILQNVLSVFWNGVEKYFKAGSWLKHTKNCQLKFWIYELSRFSTLKVNLKIKLQCKKFLSLLEIISGFRISINGSILFSSLKGIYFIWDNNAKGQGINQIIFHTVSLEKKYFETISACLCVSENIINLIV